MHTATIVNKPLILPSEALARPGSFLAALTFLGTSIYLAHAGLVAVFPATITTALTALFVAVAYLQWVSMGRARALRRAGGRSHARKVMAQALGFGLIETSLYAIGVVQLAAQGGADWSGALGVVGAVAFAVLFALANFWVKFNCCDPVEIDGAAVTVETVGDPNPPAEATDDAYLSCDEIGVISLERRLRQRGEQEARDERARAMATTTASQRLDRASGRIRTRARRAAKVAA